MVDPQNSVFLDYWQSRDASCAARSVAKLRALAARASNLHFIPDVVDEMLRVPDAASVATALWLETLLGRKVGASTGTNMWGVLQLAVRMREEGAPALLSRCCATAVNVIWRPTTTRSGLRPISAIFPRGRRRSPKCQRKIKSQNITGYLACWQGLFIRGNKEDQDYQPMSQKSGKRPDDGSRQ